MRLSSLRGHQAAAPLKPPVKFARATRAACPLRGHQAAAPLKHRDTDRTIGRVTPSAAIRPRLH